MSERIPDLKFEFHDFNDGRFVRLEQSIGGGETVLIDLHMSQLSLLAERAGLLALHQPHRPHASSQGELLRDLRHPRGADHRHRRCRIPGDSQCCREPAHLSYIRRCGDRLLISLWNNS